MADTIQIKRTTTSGNAPTSGTCQPGELWLNLADKSLGYIDQSQVAQKFPMGVASIDFTPVGLTPGPGATGAITVGGTLAVANGGTGKTTNVNNGVLIGAGANPIKASAAAPGAGALLIGASAAVPTWLAVGAAGQYLTVGAGTPAWTTLPAIPAASAATPVMDGTAAVGVDPGFSRGDHVHGTDTSRYAASNPSGYQTAAQVTASLGGYLPLTGGTLTGALTVNGGFAVGTSATGNGTITLAASVGSNNYIYSTKGTQPRWAMSLGDNSAEGSNAGSYFWLSSYSDTGTSLGTPVSISRATGAASFNGNGAGAYYASPLLGSAQISLNKSGSTKANYIVGLAASAQRWAIQIGDATSEGGSNSGSNFVITSYTDAGTGLANPITIARSTGVCTFSAAIVNGPSDRRLKENIVPLEGALDKVLSLQGVSFNLIATPDKREIGFIAQDVEPIVPEIIQTYEHAIDASVTPMATEPMMALDYPKLTALLIEAVKTLAARVEQLEAARGSHA